MAPAKDLIVEASRIGARCNETCHLARDLENQGSAERRANQSPIVGPQEPLAQIGQKARRARVGVNARHRWDVGGDRRTETLGEPFRDPGPGRSRNLAHRCHGTEHGRSLLQTAGPTAFYCGDDAGDRVATRPLVRIGQLYAECFLEGE